MTICCKCGKKIDGYHVWHYRNHLEGKDYCMYCYDEKSYRVVY